MVSVGSKTNEFSTRIQTVNWLTVTTFSHFLLHSKYSRNNSPKVARNSLTPSPNNSRRTSIIASDCNTPLRVPSMVYGTNYISYIFYKIMLRIDYPPLVLQTWCYEIAIWLHPGENEYRIVSVEVFVAYFFAWSILTNEKWKVTNSLQTAKLIPALHANTFCNYLIRFDITFYSLTGYQCYHLYGMCHV